MSDPAHDNDRATKLGNFLIDRSGVIGSIVIVTYLALGFLAYGIVESNRQGSKQSRKLEKIIADFNTSSNTQRNQLQQAIQCVLDQFAEHRTTNQTVHDNIAKALGVPPTPPTPLPERATEGDIMKACTEFYRR
jgi:hypothetical protein